MRPPTIDPLRKIQLFCREAQVLDYVRYVDDRLRVANQRFLQPGTPLAPDETARRATVEADNFETRREVLRELAAKIPPSQAE